VNSLEARAKHIFTLNGVSFNYKRKIINSSSPATQIYSVSSSTQQLGAVSADGVVDMNSTYFGFIAQEVEGQFPELVGRDAQGFRSVQYSAFVPLIIEGMKEQRSELEKGLKAQQSEIEGLRSHLREAGVLLSVPATTTTRTVSVKGLSATGAVTAHHDLVHTTRTGALELTGREAVDLDGKEVDKSGRKRDAQGKEQAEDAEEVLRRLVGSLKEELFEAKAEARRVEAEAKVETRRVEAEAKAETRRVEEEAKAETRRVGAEAQAEARRIEAEAKEAKEEMEGKLLALLKLIEDLTRKVEGSGGTRGGA
jgi:hypothetical protein